MKDKTRLRKEAQEKIDTFFQQACDEPDIQQATEYVRKARNLAMKYQLRIPREYKRRFCKHCYSFLRPGVNCRVRTQDGKVVYLCQECKRFMRFPLRS